MARNEEKQQGRLNRLWLQKEREEGRLKDVHEKRPKLSSLNSVSSVKKWIPSIKNEIEYCLQQSQLPHYPERKIAEFHLQIEGLEKEYKRFITKLRVLDPSFKDKPWTPRAYCKRRTERYDSPNIVKIPRLSDSHDERHQQSGIENVSTPFLGSSKPSSTERSPSSSEARSLALLSTDLGSSEENDAGQDQPLSFDRKRLSIAAAAFRGAPDQRPTCQAQNLARLLQAGLPNLNNFPFRQNFHLQSRETENNDVATKAPDKEKDVPLERPDCHGGERKGGQSIHSETKEERTVHLLGLDCYSSSGEEDSEA